jgi:hypothetical protein
MADTADQDGTFEPGTVDEHQHGWAPDAPGTGEAKHRVVQGHQRAFEGRDTQEASRGDGGQDPDFPPQGVGDSVSRRGEDMVRDEGKEPGRHDTGAQGESERPTGRSTARDATSVDPQDR